MARERAINMALDLTRMPAFAASMSASPLPPGVLEVIRIAAESPEACRAAALNTGQPEPVLIEAARFYLQQVLFREEADCFRTLGIRPDQSRTSARDHMRWLLRWLHPDRNRDWDAVYAKRVVNAWREVSQAGRNSRATAGPAQRRNRIDSSDYRGVSAPNRIPWIARPYEDGSSRRKSYASLAVRVIKIAAGLIVVLLVFGLTAPASTQKIISVLW